MFGQPDLFNDYQKSVIYKDYDKKIYNKLYYIPIDNGISVYDLNGIKEVAKRYENCVKTLKMKTLKQLIEEINCKFRILNTNGIQIEVHDKYTDKKIKIPPDNPNYYKSESIILVLPQDDEVFIDLTKVKPHETPTLEPHQQVTPGVTHKPGLWFYQKTDLSGNYAYGRVHDNAEGNQIELTELGGSYDEVLEKTSEFSTNNPIYLYDRNINYWISWYGSRFDPENPDTAYRKFRIFEYRYYISPNLFERCWGLPAAPRRDEYDGLMRYACEMNSEINRRDNQLSKIKIADRNMSGKAKSNYYLNYCDKSITVGNKKSQTWNCMHWEHCRIRNAGLFDKANKNDHIWKNTARICKVEPVDIIYKSSELPYLGSGINFCGFDSTKFPFTAPDIGDELDVIKVSHDIFMCPNGGSCFEREPGNDIVTIRSRKPTLPSDVDLNDPNYINTFGRHDLYWFKNPTNPLMKENRDSNYKEFYREPNAEKFAMCHKGFSGLRSYCSYPGERNLQNNLGTMCQVSLSSSDVAFGIFGLIVFAAKWLMCQFKAYMSRKILRQFDNDVRGFKYDIKLKACRTTESYCRNKALKWCNDKGVYIDTLGRYEKNVNYQFVLEIFHIHIVVIQIDVKVKVDVLII